MSKYKEMYGVWGNPIDQSLSPTIQALFASQEGRELNYKKLTASIDGDEFEKALIDFFKFGGKGCNITSPFKERAFYLLDHASERAKIAGACNTIKLIDGKLHGYTTDGYGLKNDLINLKWIKANSRILILGAGGVVASILFDIFDMLENKEVTVVNRTESRAIALKEKFKKYGNISYLSFDQCIDSSKFNLVINTIPNFSLKTISCFKVSNTTKYYDITYNLKEETTFIKSLTEQDPFIEVKDGIGMLINQGALSYEIWFGFKPKVSELDLNNRF